LQLFKVLDDRRLDALVGKDPLKLRSNLLHIAQSVHGPLPAAKLKAGHGMKAGVNFALAL